MSGTSDQRTVIVVADAVHDQGGMERAVAELIRRGQDGHAWVLVSREASPEIRDLVEWHRVRVPARPAPVRFAMFFVAAGWMVARRRSCRQGAIVHTVGAIIPNRVDVATVHYCHATAPQGTRGEGAGVLRRWNSSVDRWISLAAEHWCYRRRTRRLAAVSISVADDLARIYPGVPVALTPNGVDADHFRPNPMTRATLRAERRLATDELVVLFVGGDWGLKGLFLLIDAMGDPTIRGLPARLWVVGAGDVPRASAHADERGLAGRVDFIGPVDDVAPYYSAADLFVLPSAYETFSLVAFEAAASGLPLVATAVGAIPALVGGGEGGPGDDDQGRCGVTVARDASALAVAMRGYLSDPEGRARAGALARRRATQWSWETSVNAVEDVYAKLSAQP